MKLETQCSSERPSITAVQEPVDIRGSTDTRVSDFAIETCRADDSGPVRRVLFFEIENDPTRISRVLNVVVEEVARMELADRPDDFRLRLALEEALMNAVVHGNLEVGSDLREAGDGAYERLIERRRHQEKYRGRRVRLTCDLRRDEAVFVVRDEGIGFDVNRLPDPRSRERVGRPAGRGVLLMRAFMDEVEFSHGGTVVTMTVRGRARK